MRGSYLCATNFFGYTNKLWGHFVMFSGLLLLANKNKIPSTNTQKKSRKPKKLCTSHLRICVSVSDLKKSQPNEILVGGK